MWGFRCKKCAVPISSVQDRLKGAKRRNTGVPLAWLLGTNTYWVLRTSAHCRLRATESASIMIVD